MIGKEVFEKGIVILEQQQVYDDYEEPFCYMWDCPKCNNRNWVGETYSEVLESSCDKCRFTPDINNNYILEILDSKQQLRQTISELKQYLKDRKEHLEKHLNRYKDIPHGDRNIYYYEAEIKLKEVKETLSKIEELEQ